MQINEFTLAVDTANTGSTTNKTYKRYEENLNRSKYIATGHTLSSRDTLDLYRTFPKVSGNFRGVAKSAIKFTTDFTVGGVDGNDVVAPVIVECSFSVPVGITAANTLEKRQQLVALLDNDSIMAALMDQLEI